MSRSNDIKNNENSNHHLRKKLEKTENNYSKEAELIIKTLKRRRKVNTEFLSNIDTFIEYAKKQAKNENLNEERRKRYKDLVEEEESLKYRIKEDLKRNNELIKSIKESTKALLH